MRLINEPETGVIYCDDNLERLREMESESVDLIYLDPPFFSNRNYEVIWGDEAEIRSFEDRWKGGMNHYVDWMKERIVQMHRVLRTGGSFYLHCDTTASHYLKVMMDAVFDIGNYRAELSWKRSSAHSDTKQGRRLPGRIRDVILFYTKGEDWTWNPIYTPYDKEYVDEFYRYFEEGTRRRYRLGDLTAAKPGGDTSYVWKGVTPYRGRYWAYSKEKMQRFEREGRLVYSRTGMPSYKRYLDEMPGVALQDWWGDIKPAKKSERLGFPTQKPLALLERIIEVSSNPGDVVLDPFCGCGTTIAAAQILSRKWIGVDISLTAAEVMKARVENLGAQGVKIKGAPRSESDLRKLKPFEFQNWVMRKIFGTHSLRKTGDMGIDGFTHLEHLPVQVKRSSNVGRPIVDNFETAVERYGAKEGYIIAFSFTSGAYEEVARAKSAKGLDIELVDVDDIRTGKSHLVPPRVGREVLDLDMTRQTRRSVRELVKSDEDSEEIA